MILLLFLTACGSRDAGHDDDALALQIRTEYLALNACEGQMRVTADYGQRVYEYGINFQWERDGVLTLALTEPENLRGITAHVEQGESRLEFQGVQLETGPLSTEGLSPIDGFPALFRYITEGYIATCGTEYLGECEALRVSCGDPDTPEGQGTEGTLWFDKETHALLRGEILSDGYTVIRCEFENFTMR